MTSAEKGRRGEEIAATYLTEKGWDILERNFTAYGAEIDLIARKGTEISFVEVKFWNSFDISEMERMINRAKMKRIVRASKAYLRGESEKCTVRYDLVFISDAGRSIEHIENAFTETDAL